MLKFQMIAARVVAVFAVIAFAFSANAAGPEVGKPAPLFEVIDTNGEMVSLAQFRGKPVILEWTNHQCPYVKKHYSSGNMQSIQRDLTEDGAVWLSIISSAPGLQGHVSAAEANDLTVRRGAYPTRVLLDPSGTVGKAYVARTTPQMFLIDEEGILRFMGGIDDKPSSRIASLEGARNYMREAWDSFKAGQAIKAPSTRPYGCSVKYGS